MFSERCKKSSLKFVSFELCPRYIRSPSVNTSIRADNRNVYFSFLLLKKEEIAKRDGVVWDKFQKQIRSLVIPSDETGLPEGFSLQFTQDWSTIRTIRSLVIPSDETERFLSATFKCTVRQRSESRYLIYLERVGEEVLMYFSKLADF